MKIGIVNPYFDSLGGGERYLLSIASHLSASHHVDIFWDDVTILQDAKKRFNLNLNTVSVVPNIFAHGSFMQKLLVTRAYDVLFFLTDGSIPSSFAKHTILHIQVPFSRIDLPFWKKWRLNAVIYNSEFTRDHTDHVFHDIPSHILYPPVFPIPVAKTSKSKLILSVGRFAGLYNAKKFDVLIEAFRSLHQNKQFSEYSLALAGGLLPSDEDSFERLKELAEPLPVSFYPNCTYTKLVSLYEQSQVYWHAAGFGETKPEHMEHFGIAPVEAMSAGTVPFVYNGGGLPEIISDGENGYVWNTLGELVNKTTNLLQDPETLKKLSDQSIASTVKFSTEAFNKKIDTILRGSTGDITI